MTTRTITVFEQFLLDSGLKAEQTDNDSYILVKKDGSYLSNKELSDIREKIIALNPVTEIEVSVSDLNSITGEIMNSSQAVTLCTQTPSQEPENQVWKDNRVQFPRLISEIMATQILDLGHLAESMDLTIDEVNELFDRASEEWESIKAKKGINMDKLSHISSQDNLEGTCKPRLPAGSDHSNQEFREKDTPCKDLIASWVEKYPKAKETAVTPEKETTLHTEIKMVD